jgi:succinate dehydrogenase/fumarate reductase flavoprotein subunit
MSWVEKEDLIPPRESEVQEAIDQLKEIFSRQKGGVRPYQIKQAIKNIMWDYFGPSRNEEGMKKGLAGLKHIQENNIPKLALGSRQARYNREKMEAVEACLMIKTAILVATAALNRTESRGSHYRTDFPSSDDKHWLRNTVLRKSAEGEVDISYRQAGI